MIRVKVTVPFPAASILNQTTGRKGVWGNCQFYVNENITECDYWVVYDNLISVEKTLCPVSNTLLITGEPPSVKSYNHTFLKQFKNIITCHDDINVNNTVRTQQALPWHVGKRLVDKKSYCFGKDYDDLKSLKSFNKNKLMSIVVSGKNNTEGHRSRLVFVKELKKHFGDSLDVFGRDSLPIEDKWDAIADYKYHIVLENSSYDDYWTEKLADTYLAGAFPFYYGCKNIHDYFSKDALCEIDINNVGKSIQAIDDCIAMSAYESSIKSLEQARNMVLDEYNFFPFVHDFINNTLQNETVSRRKLYPQQYFDLKRSSSKLSIFTECLKKLLKNED